MNLTNDRSAVGFTLIELMALVAIIAVLLALLMPTLGEARYRAKETLCMTNLREVAVGFTTYASDHVGWYPKNGAYRNDETSLKNGNYWDIKSPSVPYFGESMRVFVCPLTEEFIADPDTTNSSTYALLFNTYGHPTSKGPIGCDSSERLAQYDVNGNLIADDTTNHGHLSEAMRTWYYPYLDETGVLRKINTTWKQTGQDRRFNLMAMDRLQGRGHPVRSRQSNHPEPGEAWKKSGTLWQGESYWMPKTSANYAGTDGRVVKYTYVGHIYYHEPTPEPVISVSSIGYVPTEFIVN